MPKSAQPTVRFMVAIPIDLWEYLEGEPMGTKTSYILAALREKIARETKRRTT